MVLDHWIDITTEMGDTDGLYYEIMFACENDICMLDVKLISDDGTVLIVNDGWGEIEILRSEMMLMEPLVDQEIIDEIEMDINNDMMCQD